MLPAPTPQHKAVTLTELDKNNKQTELGLSGLAAACWKRIPAGFGSYKVALPFPQPQLPLLSQGPEKQVKGCMSRSTQICTPSIHAFGNETAAPSSNVTMQHNAQANVLRFVIFIQLTTINYFLKSIKEEFPKCKNDYRILSLIMAVTSFGSLNTCLMYCRNPIDFE